MVGDRIVFSLVGTIRLPWLLTKLVLDDMGQAARVRPLLHASVLVDVRVCDRRIDGTRVLIKSGVVELRAQVLIDASGDMDGWATSGLSCVGSVQQIEAIVRAACGCPSSTATCQRGETPHSQKEAQCSCDDHGAGAVYAPRRRTLPGRASVTEASRITAVPLTKT